MTSHNPNQEHTGCEVPSSYTAIVVTGYAKAMHLAPEEINGDQEHRILDALIAHADNDDSAAEESGFSKEQIAHDRTTLSASDGLPLLIVATVPGVSGRFYFSRPLKGWPRPGHRHL